MAPHGMETASINDQEQNEGEIEITPAMIDAGANAADYLIGPGSGNYTGVPVEKVTALILEAALRARRRTDSAAGPLRT